MQPQQQRHRERGGGERDDDAGDQQRLRHRIAAESRARAAPGDGAHQQEDAAAHDVEGEDLAQRLRMDDEAVQAEADQCRRAQSEECRVAHW